MNNDQNYIKSMNLWLRNVQLAIDESEASLAANKLELSFIDKRNGLLKEQIEHDKRRLSEGEAEFKKYLSDNEQQG